MWYMGISLNAFDVQTKSNAGVELELIDIRTNKGAGAFITLLGMDSDVVKDFQEQRVREHAELIKAGKTIPESESKLMGIKLLATCTVGWRELDDSNGSPLEFSHEKAVEIYTNYPLIRDFVDREIYKRSNFLLG